MKNLRLALIVSLVLGCVSKNRVENKGCKENIDFKTSFFRIISEIDCAINPNTMDKCEMSINDFHMKIDSLLKVVDVNVEDLAQTNSSYSSYGVFLKDKKKWEQWYKQNKCENLQW